LSPGFNAGEVVAGGDVGRIVDGSGVTGGAGVLIHEVGRENLGEPGRRGEGHRRDPVIDVRRVGGRIDDFDREGVDARPVGDLNRVGARRRPGHVGGADDRVGAAVVHRDAEGVGSAVSAVGVESGGFPGKQVPCLGQDLEAEPGFHAHPGPSVVPLGVFGLDRDVFHGARGRVDPGDRIDAAASRENAPGVAARRRGGEGEGRDVLVHDDAVGGHREDVEIQTQGGPQFEGALAAHEGEQRHEHDDGDDRFSHPMPPKSSRRRPGPGRCA